MDDSTFLFDNIEDIERGANFILEHYARFGLIIHTGNEAKKSKSEAIHIPGKLNLQPTPAGAIINLKDGTYLQVTDKIKYLGSTVTQELRDETNVATQISISYSCISRMKDIFSCREVAMSTKAMLYIAIPLVAVLWGCESWAIKQKEKDKLETIPQYCDEENPWTTMKRVHEERITNEEVRFKFMGIQK
jgi:hypothetical protein